MIEEFKQYFDNFENLTRSSEFLKYKKCFFEHKKILFIGNGGSNAIASHISNDAVKIYNKNSLSNSDSTMLSCFINDYGMDNAYVEFLKVYSDTNSLIILISSSGESKNIINCIKYCENNKLKYGLLTGFKENNSARLQSKSAYFDLHIASKNYGVVECLHQIFLHAIF